MSVRMYISHGDRSSHTRSPSRSQMFDGAPLRELDFLSKNTTGISGIGENLRRFNLPTLSRVGVQMETCPQERHQTVELHNGESEVPIRLLKDIRAHLSCTQLPISETAPYRNMVKEKSNVGAYTASSWTASNPYFPTRPY